MRTMRILALDKERALAALNAAGLNDEKFQAAIANLGSEQVCGLAQALLIFNEYAREGLSTEQNRDFALAAPDYAAEMASVLATLSESGRLNPVINQGIGRNAQYAGPLSDALTRLSRARLLDDNIQDALFAHPAKASEISHAILRLAENHLLDKEELKRVILEKPQFAELVIVNVLTLQMHRLLTDNLVEAIAQEPERAEEITSVAIAAAPQEEQQSSPGMQR